DVHELDGLLPIGGGAVGEVPADARTCNDAAGGQVVVATAARVETRRPGELAEDQQRGLAPHRGAASLVLGALEEGDEVAERLERGAQALRVVRGPAREVVVEPALELQRDRLGIAGGQGLTRQGRASLHAVDFAGR